MTTTTAYGSFFNATGVLNPATVVTNYISGADADWREQMEACGAIDAIIAEYTEAINKALPKGITLVDDEFIGPHPSDPDFEFDTPWDDLDLDEASDLFARLNEVIEGVDLSDIVQGHSDAAEEAAVKAVLNAVATRDATIEKLQADARAVSEAVGAALRLNVPATTLAAKLGITRARVYQLRDGRS